MNLDLLLNGFTQILNVEVILLVFLGAFGGILVGCLPGLTATMAVALMIPFTYGLPFSHSMAMLLGIYCGGMFGGSISAILINTPGTPASAATVLDGHPLAKRGEASRALAMALFGSFCGGIISALIMTFLSPEISKVALKFGTAEYFSLAIFGLSVIISISGRSILKGIFAGLFGLLISSIGIDPISGFPRYTFGLTDLYEGFSFVPALIGLFALSEVFIGVEHIIEHTKITNKIAKLFPSKEDIKQCWKVIGQSSIIGTFVGAVPGAGGDIAAFLSYSEAKRASKNPEKFGTGVIEGVAAAEAGNNACSGGAMIPLLTLGIPGDPVTAVLLGAFILQGLKPGPLLFQDHLPTVYVVFACMILANIVFFIVGLFSIRFFAKIIDLDRKMLLPIILVLSIVGSFAIRNNLSDVGVAIGFGIIGYFFQKRDIPFAPILLALILGPMAESNLRRTLVISNGSFSMLFTEPISAAFLILSVASVISGVIRLRKIEAKLANQVQDV